MHDPTSLRPNPLVAPAYLLRPEVAERLRCGTRTVQELTRRRAIPHVVRPKGRTVLYPMDWLVAWERDPGMPLEVLDLADGGRIVRPVNDRPTEA